MVADGRVFATSNRFPGHRARPRCQEKKEAPGAERCPRGAKDFALVPGAIGRFVDAASLWRRRSRIDFQPARGERNGYRRPCRTAAFRGPQKRGHHVSHADTATWLKAPSRWSRETKRKGRTFRSFSSAFVRVTRREDMAFSKNGQGRFFQHGERIRKCGKPSETTCGGDRWARWCDGRTVGGTAGVGQWQFTPPMRRACEFGRVDAADERRRGPGVRSSRRGGAERLARRRDMHHDGGY